MTLRMNKRLDLLAKYFSDLSKVLFGGVILKPLVERSLYFPELFIGSLSAVALIVIAYFTQPKE
jgi:hypothetical protein